jgi:ubiquitin-protein ligase
VSIKTPIIHPNVYTSGVVCLGTKWLPTQGLDLLVGRLAQIVTFDPNVLNGQSPANRDALSWYESQRRRHPKDFPTASATLASASKPSGITWVNKK